MRTRCARASSRRARGVSAAPPFAAFVHDALDDGARGAADEPRDPVAGVRCCSRTPRSAPSASGSRDDDPRRRVVFNPIDLRAFDPARHDRGRLASGSAWRPTTSCSRWSHRSRRGRASAMRSRRSPHCAASIRAPGCCVVGEAKFVARATRYDNRAYLAELRELARDRGLEPQSRWLGERDDVPAILAAVDVLLVPSWAEPFGRVVVEGMAMGCLVAATSVGGPAEIIEDGVDGLLLAPRDPLGWAAGDRRGARAPRMRRRIRRHAPRRGRALRPRAFARRCSMATGAAVRLSRAVPISAMKRRLNSSTENRAACARMRSGENALEVAVCASRRRARRCPRAGRGCSSRRESSSPCTPPPSAAITGAPLPAPRRRRCRTPRRSVRRARSARA